MAADSALHQPRALRSTETSNVLARQTPSRLDVGPIAPRICSCGRRPPDSLAGVRKPLLPGLNRPSFRPNAHPGRGVL